MVKTMTPQNITLSLDKNMATILLNNPKKHNMLGLQELEQLDAIVDKIENEKDIRAVIVTGSGSKTFCSGFNLNQISNVDWEDDPFQRAVTRLEDIKAPTICALNGSVYGGGTEIAVACDFRIGVVGMELQLPAAEIGVHYSIAGLKRFSSLLGLQTTRRILLGAEIMDGHELLRLGYLDQIVERSKLMEVAITMADRLSSLAPLSVCGMKGALNQIAQGNLEVSNTKQTIETCFKSDDFYEGVTAKKEKRLPQFSGK